MRQPRIDVEFVTRHRHGQDWQVVTFTLKGHEAPFYEIPYSVFRRHDTEFLRAVRAGVDAGVSFEEGN